MGIRYLVTGAAGHLGNTITNKLVKAGEDVGVLVLPCDKNASHIPKEAQVFTGDVCDKKTLYPFFSCDPESELIVIHAAGIVTISTKYNKMVYDINVGGTKNIIELCKEHNVKKLIYISSVHAIPELPKGQVMAEIAEFDPQKVIGLYAKTKAEATALVLKAASQGLNASVVHPSGICGPYDYGNGHVTQLLIDFYKGSLSAGVKGGYDFVDVRDVAEGVIACCNKGKAGECYILSNRYFSVKELFSIFHLITGKKRIKTIIPMWFAKATAPLSELYYKLLRQTPLFTAYSLYTLSSNALFSHEKAKKELAYFPRPFEETVKDTIAWLKNQNRI